MKSRFGLAAVIAFLCTALSLTATQQSVALDDYVYNNLQKSRDALIDQKRELQRAYDDTGKQIDSLNQRLQRIDSYMKQVDKALKDVDEALRGK